MRCRTILILAIACFAGLEGCTGKTESENSFPLVESFNDNWQFYRFNGSKKQHSPDDIAGVNWEKVTLPHTAKIEPKIVNDQWQGDAFYRKAFTLPKAWKGKTVYLRFEGAMNKADVWFNGTHVATHQGGYLPFIVDLSALGKFGRANNILIKLDNRDNPVTGPKPLEVLDFNTYGGIYRDINLIVKNSLHITDTIRANTPAGGGIFVTYPKVSPQFADVQIKTHIENNHADNRLFSVEQSLLHNGRQAASGTSKAISLAPGKSIENIQTLKVNNPALWSPKSPNLYQLTTRIIEDDKVVDLETTRIGIRRIEFQKDGFFINGEKMFLRGVNRHQEYPYIGYALSNNAAYRDAVKIKSAGFDYVRLSHYPHSKAFMEAADELGIVLLDAILGWQYFNEDPAFLSHVLQTCRDMIRRDRNHPSVIAWECSLNESQMPESFIDKLHSIVHEEYPGNQAYSAGWTEQGYDIFLQARQHRLNHYTEPGKPYIVSEYGDWEYYAMNAGLNQDNWKDLLQAERSSRQLLSDGETRLLQQATNIQEAHNDNFNTPAVADGYWVMFDYNRGYADNLEASGIMSIDRLPKFSYYFFQSQRNPAEQSPHYSSGPMVHIASYWTLGSNPKVRVFSNCENVELLFNEKSTGTQGPDQNAISGNLAHPPFTFDLKSFTPGTLKAVCYIDEKAMAEHIIITPEAPAGLKLSVDASNKSPQAGVNDVVFIYASLIDKNGTVVPASGEVIEFDVTGDAVMISPAKLSTEAGIAAGLFKIGSSAGPVVVAAGHPSIGKEEIKIEVIP